MGLFDGLFQENRRDGDAGIINDSTRCTQIEPMQPYRTYAEEEHLTYFWVRWKSEPVERCLLLSLGHLGIPRFFSRPRHRPPNNKTPKFLNESPFSPSHPPPPRRHPPCRRRGRKATLLLQSSVIVLQGSLLSMTGGEEESSSHLPLSLSLSSSQCWDSPT